MFQIFSELVKLLTTHSVNVTVGVTPSKPVIVEDAPVFVDPKAKLIELLSDTRYRFRSINRLAKAIGASRWETEEYLAEVDARPSRRNPNLFGLTSRVGERQYA
jgi:hypothetical protein